MSTPNWGRLKAQGRVKDVGLPWNADEAKALAEGVPADYVRRGALSLDDYEDIVAADEKALKKNGELPVEALSRTDLQNKAIELEIAFTPEVTDETLRSLIAQAPAKKASAKKAPAKRGRSKKTK